jgi:hypothetical protein
MSFRILVSGVAIECDTPKEALALVNELTPSPPPKYEAKASFLREAPPLQETKELGSDATERSTQDDVALYT